MDPLDLLFRTPPSTASYDSLSGYRRALLHGMPPAADTSAARALYGGFVADRLGYAFAAGYQAALGALTGLPASTFAALCATEAKGGHPRAIETTLSEDGRLDGVKSFVTCGELAEVLLVVARTGVHEDGRPRLVLARVSRTSQGVTFAENPRTPFAPEVSHPRVTLAHVRADAVLPGDGYDRYLKPFRTIEDSHVSCAVTGYLVRVARRWHWPEETLDALAQQVAALSTIAAMPAQAPSTHLALSGALSALRATIAASMEHWQAVDADESARFTRDLPLLAVADGVRKKRRAAAGAALARSP